MQKFFVKSNQINNDIITIIGQDVNHIKNVLRLKENDKINICNNDTGENFKCNILEFDDDSILCKIIEKYKISSKQDIEITIFQGLPKADKMELIIQKCTELGVKNIVPVEMEHCVVKLDAKSGIKKIERWQKIAEAASKQCGRNSICLIEKTMTIKDICSILNNYDILLVPYENEKNNSFKKVIQKIKYIKEPKIGIVIGPEGGFSNEEIEELKQYGGSIITLGNRILRTETVAIAMTSSIMYEFDNLG